MPNARNRNSLSVESTSQASWHGSRSHAGDHVQSQAWHHAQPDGIVLDTRGSRFHSSFLPILHRPGVAADQRPLDGPEAWSRRVRAFGIEAPRGSDAYQVALILVASVELGHNVERLARRTGSPRPLVSKAARRFIDNGVWSEGRTVGQWIADPAAHDAFQRDVEVGLGKLLRRVGPSGRMEWAEPGNWTKSFDPDAQTESPAATYVDAPPQPAEPIALAEELEADQPAAPPAPARTETRSTATPPPAEAADDASPAQEPDDSDPPDEDQEPAPSLDEVFAGTVWLR